MGTGTTSLFVCIKLFCLGVLAPLEKCDVADIKLALDEEPNEDELLEVLEESEHRR